MNTIREIQTLNKRELENSISSSASWHTDYRDTAYVYIGGLAFDLTEGDIITIFSQYGEPVWVKLVRDRETGKSKGFAFLKYEDQRSADLAVDNLGGATVLGRKLKVDHTRYKKRDDEDDEKYNVSIGPQARSQEPGDSPENDDSDNLPSARRHIERVPIDAIAQEHKEEDPMQDYIASERREKVKTSRDSREGRPEKHHHHHRRHKRRSYERD